MQVILIAFLGILCFCQANGREYSFRLNRRRTEVRKAVLKDYDRVTGPLKYGRKDFLTVQFRIVILKLLEVNTRDETLKVEGWVQQRWTDGILAWNRTKLSKISYARFSADEIWVPDLALMNNADPREKLSGGPSKFVTAVNCNHKGACVWTSPATFTSSCKLNVKYWPFDTQVCTLTFGSWTHNDRNLKIKAWKVRYKKGSISNGEWTIDDIETDAGNTVNRAGKLYSTLSYRVTLTRKPTYVLFYLAPPAVALVILALLSFFIPTESGERISFVTTILLAKMVFLLMLPEYLPRTSDELPILGILLIFSMFLVALVLIGTIFVLACHHREGTPSMFIQKMFFPLKFLVKKHPLKPNKEWFKKKIQMVLVSFKGVFLRRSFTLNRVSDAVTNQGMETEMQQADTKNIIPIDYGDPLDQESVQASVQEGEGITWQDVAVKLNSVFFFGVIGSLLVTGLAVFLAY